MKKYTKISNLKEKSVVNFEKSDVSKFVNLV